MKPRTLLILLLLLVACGLFVAISRTDLFKPRPASVESRKIFARPIIDPVKLTISDGLGVEMVFSKSTGVWQMTSPMNSAVKTDRLENIIRMMEGLEYSRYFSPEGEDGLADSMTGLDKPIWTIELTGQAGEKAKLLVGRQVPRLGSAKPETFVRPAGAKRTFIVGLDISAGLGGDMNDYRDMTVLKFDPDKFLMLKFTGRDSYTLANGDAKTKTYDGRWRIVGPVQADCDPAKIKALIERLRKIEAERFLDAGPGGVDFVKLGLDKPQLMIEFIGQDENTLKLGNNLGQSVVAALNDETVFTLPVEALDELQPAMDNLRIRTLLPFNQADVEKIIIQHSQAKTVLVKISTGWKRTLPSPGNVEQKEILALLQSLSTLRAERWITSSAGEPMDIINPAVVISLTVKNQDRDELLTLRIGQAGEDEKVLYCRSSASPTVTAVKASDIDRVMKSEEMLLSENPPATQPATQPTTQPEQK